jgi:FkbM family methyltransferase
VPHILVEPVGQWRDPVSKSYRSAGVEFRFVEAAASNVDGTAELELVRILPGDIPSHAHLKTSAHAKDPQLEYQRTPVRRMDSLIEEMAPPAPIFLKIDVDGAEMDVIEGCAGAMDKICAIAVEMSIKNFPHRVNSIMNLGFEPIEIYDMCYYDNRFVQADILFVNTALIDQEATGFYQDGFDISRWSEHKL